LTTRRLYYDDSVTRSFEARVAERLVHSGRPALVLDQTYFYPTGGGQPCDLGTINGVAVVDVFTRPDDLAVVHVLAGEISVEQVAAEIDWPRRFDLMQHHTGQHILSRAFINVAEAMTVGFHLGEDSLTIDLDTPAISLETLDQVENLANQIVFENRPVTARIVSKEEFETLNVRMRKLPDHLATDGLRVVEIGGFDQTACGGTHVALTGAVGLIKVIKMDRHGQESRVEFRCGQRALLDYRQRNRVTNQLASDLTTAVSELDQAVGRLRDDFKLASSSLKSTQERLIIYEADALLEQAVSANGLQVVQAVFENRDSAELRMLASRLVASPGHVALLGAAGEKSQLVFARSADLSLDMVVALRLALQGLGSDRGGGRPEFAQGGGVPASTSQIEQALRSVQESFSAQG
jgi:alanyl-tRNA synthetase